MTSWNECTNSVAYCQKSFPKTAKKRLCINDNPVRTIDTFKHWGFFKEPLYIGCYTDILQSLVFTKVRNQY